RRFDAVGDDPLPRGATSGARASFNECHDGFEHVGGCAEISLMHTQLRAAEAHHHVAILRETAARDSLQSERAEILEQLVGVLGSARGLQLERELPRVGTLATPPPQRLQREKHFTGPARKFCRSSDHTSVDTSISPTPMRMLFTELGR